MSEVGAARTFQAVALVAWALGAVAIAGLGSIVFIVPAGVLLVAAGCFVLADWQSVRAGLHQVQRKYPSRYPSPDRVTYWRVYGGAAVFIGAVWVVAGAAALA